MKKMVTASAPGKFHLIGEYSAVYLKPAILCAVDRRVTVTLKVSSTNRYFQNDNAAQEAVKAIQSFIEKKYKIKTLQYEIDVSSTLPTGRGMGSSAALSAAIAGAFFALHELPWDLDEIFNAAYEGEKVFHGNPSGGDLAVCIHGGVVWFRKESENVKLFKKIKIPTKILYQILLIDSGKPEETTKEMVAMFLEILKSHEEKVKTFANDQEVLSRKLLDAFIAEDKSAILDIISQSQKNLEKVGVVGKIAQKLAKDISKVAGVKISGAGGFKKGCGILVAFCKDKKEVKTYCIEKKLQYLDIKIENLGIIIHE